MLPWFRITDILYVPTHFTGWLIMLAAEVYRVYTLIDIDSRSHSVSDTLINFSFN